MREKVVREPDRPVPVIHGIFLSNTELHTAHGYPPEGCSNTDPIVFENLQRVTDLTEGMYFPGTTPLSIVANFTELMHRTIPSTGARSLLSVTIINETNGEARTGSPASAVNASATPLQTDRRNASIFWGGGWPLKERISLPPARCRTAPTSTGTRRGTGNRGMSG
ncbi:MAG: hypothetical protein JW913_06535 [Chitinispirillaceae bacterium]|nr:hypothetical protein [Chitinispirillaceae bacterium]